MRIGVDYRLANSSERGMAKYCRELLADVLARDNVNHYILFIDEKPTHILEGDNVEWCQIKRGNYILTEQLSLPKAVRNNKCDVLWCPNNTFPIFLDNKTKLLVSIHDLIFFNKNSKRGSLKQQIGKLYRKFILKHFYSKIDSYLTVSKFSANEIRRVLNPEFPIGVTYNSIDRFKSEFSKVRNSHQFAKQDYFFTVSGDAPSKNLETLIDVISNEFPDEKLIIAGVSKNASIRQRQTSNIIFLPAAIDVSHLMKYYAESKCFIFPSKYEGFGIPLLEAAVVGIPILASNRTSIPEILEDKGLLMEPTYDGINKAINSFLNHEYENAQFEYSDLIKKYSSENTAADVFLESLNILKHGK